MNVYNSGRLGRLDAIWLVRPWPRWAPNRFAGVTLFKKADGMFLLY